MDFRIHIDTQQYYQDYQYDRDHQYRLKYYQNYRNKNIIYNHFDSQNKLIHTNYIVYNWEINQNPDPDEFEYHGIIFNPRPDREHTIYDDTQNVHDDHVQESVRKSISNILKDPKPEDSMVSISGSPLSKSTIQLLNDFLSLKDKHSILNVTFKELLDFVWARIMRHENKLEIIKIF